MTTGNRHERRKDAKFGTRKQVEQFNLGEKVEFTDYTEFPAQLEKLIDDGRVVGALTLYKLTMDTPGKVNLGMMNGGFTVEQTFDLLTTIRRSMMDTLGFIDLADKSLMANIQDDVACAGWQWQPGVDSAEGQAGDFEWRTAETEREAQWKAFSHKGEFRPLFGGTPSAPKERPPELTYADARDGDGCGRADAGSAEACLDTLDGRDIEPRTEDTSSGGEPG